jgi:Tfp pilus assembly PilM family ATPase
MSQTVIGLDIGSYSVKAAVVETGLRKYQWVGFCEHLWNRDEEGTPVDEDLSDAVTAVLENVSDRNAIVTSIPGAKILNRELTLPFSNDKEIRNVLDFELDGQFPMAIDDLVYDYTILEKEPGGSSKILCSAVERKWFEKFLSELTEAGANPRIVCMDTLAAGELVAHAGQVSAYGPPDESDAVALIDIFRLYRPRQHRRNGTYDKARRPPSHQSRHGRDGRQLSRSRIHQARHGAT